MKLREILTAATISLITGCATIGSHAPENMIIFQKDPSSPIVMMAVNTNNGNCPNLLYLYASKRINERSVILDPIGIYEDKNRNCDFSDEEPIWVNEKYREILPKRHS